ncbi:unnamed protein product [Owenia fusiformis]|uniref:WD repeat-containing protein 46 n=1 Tax=Owenia fusiformis TaxID=6347 RepID=A0A8J1U0Z6_OWEFU|nr:unnamed protein product [Owenia fusiformis]
MTSLEPKPAKKKQRKRDLKFPEDQSTKKETFTLDVDKIIRTKNFSRGPDIKKNYTFSGEKGHRKKDKGVKNVLPNKSSQTQILKGKGLKNQTGRLQGTQQKHGKPIKSRFQDRKTDPYPGDAPIPIQRLQKYKRGEDKYLGDMKNQFETKKLKFREKKISDAVKQAARTETLLNEQPGFLEVGADEDITTITQHDISNAVDITSAQKYFELKLKQFGPYRANYSRNGRYLLMAGNLGHVAAMDWQTKKLMCEFNAMEAVTDAKWLHIETMLAVSQKQWTYIYDNQGLELHCLKVMDSVLKLEFLPYHFLLVGANARGYLSWLDVSIGQKVAGFQTSMGRLDVMCQNPANAIIHLGHTGGTVTLWSPNIKEPLVKMLCHGGAVRAVDVDHTGTYMATSGVDRKLKIWDLRMYKSVHEYRIGGGAGQLSFSQRGLLAAGIGSVVEVYQDPCRNVVESPYLRHQCPRTVASTQFCPYEDVLGVGHGGGFSSLLIPGAGEPNFDALEANPFQSKKQRRNAEVQMLLQKIQPDMITVDTSALGKVDVKTYAEKIEERNKLLFLKPETIEFEPRHKKKGRSKTGHHENRKQGYKEEMKREFIKDRVQEKLDEATRKREEKKNRDTEQGKPKGGALSRFAKS